MFQAVNKLRGTAKQWYDSFVKNESCWAAWKWKEWRDKISFTFQIRRNMHSLFRDVLDCKPIQGQSLYEYYFEQKSKIDKLRLNFTEVDVISLIIGNINDSNISASVEAGNITSCDKLASFLHGRVWQSPVITSHENRPTPRNFTKHFATSSSSHSEIDNRSSAQNQQANSSKSVPAVTVSSHQLQCYGCGGNHKKVQCTAVCEFCSRRGHSESYCRVKKSKDVKNEVKRISTSYSKNKFHKIGWFCTAGIY